MSGSRSVMFLLLINVVCVCQGVFFLPVGPPPSASRGSGAGPTRALLPGTRCRRGWMRPGCVCPKHRVPDRWSACAQQIWHVQTVLDARHAPRQAARCMQRDFWPGNLVQKDISPGRGGSPVSRHRGKCLQRVCPRGNNVPWSQPQGQWKWGRFLLKGKVQ